MANRELKYFSAKNNYDSYKHWEKTRNKDRAEMERKFGFDLKHSVHLVRLMRMGQEILETGKVNVDRTFIDAEELKAIRQGSWTYDMVEQYATDMDKKLDELYKKSKLRFSVNTEFVGNLCTKVISEYARDNWQG